MVRSALAYPVTWFRQLHFLLAITTSPTNPIYSMLYPVTDVDVTASSLFHPSRVI